MNLKFSTIIDFLTNDNIQKTGPNLKNSFDVKLNPQIRTPYGKNRNFSTFFS